MRGKLSKAQNRTLLQERSQPLHGRESSAGIQRWFRPRRTTKVPMRVCEQTTVVQVNWISNNIIGVWTQLALAYAIHKSFIFIRVPITAAVTPKVVKTLRGWGWDIGKRKPKSIPKTVDSSKPT
jgi:hypothetical protein